MSEVQTVCAMIHETAHSMMHNYKPGEVPKEQKFEEIEAATVSGDITADGTKISGNAGVETVSGDITLSGIQASSVSANSVSGEIRLNDADITGAVTAETVSGDVSGNVLGSHSYKVNSVSGDKTYPEGTNSAPVVSVSTTSGDVNLG